MTTAGFTEFFLKFGMIIAILSYLGITIRKYLSVKSRPVPTDENDPAILQRVSSSTDDASSAQGLSEELEKLQKLAEKTSEERERLLLFQSGPKFDEQTASQMTNKFSAMEKQINSALKRKQNRTEVHFEQTDRATDMLHNELLDLESYVREIMDVVSLMGKDTSTKNKFRRHLMEETTQTANETEQGYTNKEFAAELFDNENLKSVLFAVKDCMDQIVHESANHLNANMVELSSFLVHNGDLTKKQLGLFVDEHTDRNAQLDAFQSLVAQTVDIEKQLLDVFLLLDRQLVDIQAVFDTLQFFNNRFVHFAEKCDLRWNNSGEQYGATCSVAEDTKGRLNSGSGKLSRISDSLTRHSEILDDLMNELAGMAQEVSATEDVGGRSLKLVSTVEQMAVRLRGIEDRFSSNMDQVHKSLDKQRQDLDPLIRYVEDMEVLNNLVKNLDHQENATLWKPYAAAAAAGNPLALMDSTDRGPSVVTIPDSRSVKETASVMCFDKSWTYTSQKTESQLSIASSSIMLLIDNVIQRKNLQFVKDSGWNKARDIPWKSEQNRRELQELSGRITSELTLADMNSDCLIPNSSSSSSGSEEI